MKDPNLPKDFPNQIRKAFVGTEPSPAPTNTKADKAKDKPTPPADKDSKDWSSAT